MFSNPIIKRYSFSQLRLRNFLVYFTIYVSFVALLLYINYVEYTQQSIYRTVNIMRTFREIYYQFIFLQMLFLWIFCTFNSATAIKNEVTGDTYAFFRMLPLSSVSKTTGILLGKNQVLLILSLSNFVFLAVFGSLSQMSNAFIIQDIAVISSIALFLNTTALLLSVQFTNDGRKSYVGYILVGLSLLIFAFWLLTNIHLFRSLHLQRGFLFTIEMPLLLLFTAVALYFSLWSIAGLLRKFTLEDEPLFSRLRAYLFTIGSQIIIIGLFYRSLTIGQNEDDILRSLLRLEFVSLWPIVIVMFGSARDFSKYFEHCGRDLSIGKNKPLLRTFMYSNISLSLGLFVIWILSTLSAEIIANFHWSWPQYIYRIFIVLTFYLFLVLLGEVYIAFRSPTGRIGFLLMFIFGLYTTLPFILGAIFNNDNLFHYSPVGFYFRILYDLEFTPIGAWILNLILCLFPFGLLFLRYKKLIATRRSML